jgi:hypothetical protein
LPTERTNSVPPVDDLSLNYRDPSRTPLPTERTDSLPPVDDANKAVTKPKSIVDEKWFPVVIVVPIVVVVAVIVGIFVYRHRSTKAKETVKRRSPNFY